MYSIDLSAATDRLPLVIQALVLSKIAGNHSCSLGASWFETINSSPFFVKEKGVPTFRVNYSVGQGIGLYSS